MWSFWQPPSMSSEKCVSLIARTNRWNLPEMSSLFLDRWWENFLWYTSTLARNWRNEVYAIRTDCRAYTAFIIWFYSTQMIVIVFIPYCQNSVNFFIRSQLFMCAYCRCDFRLHYVTNVSFVDLYCPGGPVQLFYESLVS